MADHCASEHPGVLLTVKCHTSYKPEGDSGKLLELAAGDVLAVVEDKPETGWCVSRTGRKSMGCIDLLCH